jgi:hypothetical protein
MFFFLTLLGLAVSQDCFYRFGGLELDLNTIKGQSLRYDGNGGVYRYSVCTNQLACSAGSVSTSCMFSYHPDGINECFYLAQMNSTLQPFYDFQFASWIFNFSNGMPCSDPSQINHTTSIAWNCNPNQLQPRIRDVFHYDACNDFVEVEWEGACNPAPPPNERCEFRSGFQSLNLSTIKGQKLSFTDGYNRQWQLTPCANGLKCVTGGGTSLNVMSEVADSTGQCIKYLGVWSGDSIPFYDRTIFGQDYWDFFWMDGQECGDGGPLEVLNVRYYCNSTVNGAAIRSAQPAGPPCQFRIEVDTNLACSGENKKQEFFGRADIQENYFGEDIKKKIFLICNL